jgi:hypothetical protein
MDAKTRHRQRLKLQAALARVLEVLLDNAVAKIPPDKITAKLAVQLVAWLSGYAADAGVPLLRWSEEPDISRAKYLIGARRKATGARYTRRLKPQLIAEIVRLRKLDADVQRRAVQLYRQAAADPSATRTARR